MPRPSVSTNAGPSQSTPHPFAAPPRSTKGYAKRPDGRDTTRRHSLQPDQRERFQRLLFTYGHEQVRRRESAPLFKPGEESAFEAKFGDGHYADRRDLLRTTLARLRGRRKADLVGVLEALEQAKVDAMRAALDGLGMDNSRRIAAEIKFVTAAIPRIRRFFESLAPDARNMRTINPVLSALDIIENSPLLQLNKVVDGKLVSIVIVDGTLKQFPIRTRRDRAGHQPQQYLHVARGKLREAGVRDKETQHDLLTAAGLLRFRDPGLPS